MIDEIRSIGFNGCYVNFHTYVPRAGDKLPEYIMTEQHRAKAAEIISEVLEDGDQYGYFVEGITPKSAEMFHPKYLLKVFNTKLSSLLTLK